LVESLQIPSLTEDIVYCPKCGAINAFKKSTSGKLLKCFCCRCGVRMNDLWDGYQTGTIKSIKCFSCSELTFKGEVFCIVCGAKQKKIRIERAEKLAQAKSKKNELTLPEEVSVKNIEKIRLYHKR